MLPSTAPGAELCGNVLIIPWFLLPAFKFKKKKKKTTKLCKESAQTLVNTLVHFEVVILFFFFLYTWCGTLVAEGMECSAAAPQLRMGRKWQ